MDERFKELDECREKIRVVKVGLEKWKFVREHPQDATFSVRRSAGHFQEIRLDADLVDVCQTVMIDRIRKDLEVEESRFREVCLRLSELAADVETEG